jgi:hypothetical protein
VHLSIRRVDCGHGIAGAFGFGIGWKFGSRIVQESFEFSEPDTGGRATQSMSAKIKYTNEPMGKPTVAPDFLPSPEDLVFREDGVKIALALSKRSIEFFKSEAAKHNTQYQRMIRRLLEAYAEHHARPLTTRTTRTRLRRAG